VEIRSSDKGKVTEKKLKISKNFEPQDVESLKFLDTIKSSKNSKYSKNSKIEEKSEISAYEKRVQERIAKAKKLNPKFVSMNSMTGLNFDFEKNSEKKLDNLTQNIKNARKYSSSRGVAGSPKNRKIGSTTGKKKIFKMLESDSKTAQDT
jgi:hypothetical protein